MEGFQEAYVLHTRPYTDSKLLVEWFTRCGGRVATVARLSKSKKATVYQQFRRAWIDFRGRSALKTLSAVEFEAFAPINVHYNALKCGFYLNELIMRSMPEGDPNEELFDSYHCVLNDLLQSDFDWTKGQVVLRNFELDCLIMLGFAVDFTHDCETGSAVTADRRYRLLPRDGFVECDLSGPDRTIFAGSSLLAIAERRFEDSQVLTEAKYVCRQLVTEMIGDKPLKSRELFR